jgi:hypothetical protein
MRAGSSMLSEDHLTCIKCRCFRANFMTRETAYMIEYSEIYDVYHDTD